MSTLAGIERAAIEYLREEQRGNAQVNDESHQRWDPLAMVPAACRRRVRAQPDYRALAHAHVPNLLSPRLTLRTFHFQHDGVVAALGVLMNRILPSGRGAVAEIPFL
jgi:hypothetical protein